MKLEERNASLEQRMENVGWVLPSVDERLTLVSQNLSKDLARKIPKSN